LEKRDYSTSRGCNRGETKRAGGRHPATPAGPDPIRCSASIADAGRLLLSQLLCFVAQLIGLLDEGLLLGWIFFEVRLQAEQQVLVDERFHVVRLDLERAIDGVDALLHEIALLV